MEIERRDGRHGIHCQTVHENNREIQVPVKAKATGKVEVLPYEMLTCIQAVVTFAKGTQDWSDGKTRSRRFLSRLQVESRFPTDRLWHDLAVILPQSAELQSQLVWEA
jgi:hypothetical protein